MVFIAMLLPLAISRILLTGGTVRTHGTVLLTNPMVLLAIHGILLPAIQTVVTPVIHSPLQLTPRTASRAISNMMALSITAVPHTYLIAIVVRDGSVAHRTAAE